jgi:branched-chain amino acid transport system substrate-binding protein
MIKKFLTGLLVLSVMTIALPAIAEEEIEVGIVLPMSGPLAKVGLTNLWGHELAVNDINNAGGIKSMGGAKLKLIVADSQGKPEIGNSETERLIQAGVAVILGAYQSAVSFTGTQVAERYKTPYIIPVSVADKITERNFKYTFRPESKASWFARDQFYAIRDFAKENGVEIKRVAILYEDTLYGQSTAKGQRKYAKEMNWKVAANISYPANTPDMTTTIAKLKASKPDVVVHNSYMNDSLLLARTSKELDFNPKAFFAAVERRHEARGRIRSQRALHQEVRPGDGRHRRHVLHLDVDPPGCTRAGRLGRPGEAARRPCQDRHHERSCLHGRDQSHRL